MNVSDFIILLLSLVVILLSGTIIFVLRKQDGYIFVKKTDEKKIFTLELHKEPEKLEELKYIRFRVVNEDDE